MKRWALPIVAGLAVGGGAFALGRASVRPDAVERVRTVEKRVEVAVAAEQRASSQVRVEYREGPVRWKERVVYRDGGVVEVTRDVEQGPKEGASTTGSASSSRQEASRLATEAETFAEAVRPAQRDWSASVLVGVERLRLRAPEPVVGALVERRILGPVRLGVWMRSDMSGGVSLGVAW